MTDRSPAAPEEMSPPRQIMLKLVELAVATAPTKEIDRTTHVVYAKHLSRFDLAAVLAAIDRLILRATFFPSVAEIVEAIGAPTQVEAANAWRLALETCPSRGTDSRISPAIAECVRLCGGWDVLRFTPTARIHFVERKFLELYPDVAPKAARQITSPPRVTAEITHP